MTIAKPIYALKEEQKKLVTKIRSNKKEGLSSEVERYTFRHQHIAYCELRGRARWQIEKPADHNKPDERYINTIKQEYIEKIKEWRCQNEENVCDCKE